MGWIHLHENRQRVREALQTGYVDEVVTLRATAFDELAAAMYTFGYWEQLECIKVDLDKDEDDVWLTAEFNTRLTVVRQQITVHPRGQ